MSDVNHSAISSILGSEIVGEFKAGHGQIGSLGDAQRFVEARRVATSPAALHHGEVADIDQVVKVFRELREARGDRGSPDLYVADPERNAALLAACRKAGLQASDYALNKALLSARKKGLLKNLRSARTVFNDEDYAFASELAATELKYLTGASIDDLVCDPALAARFDAIAKRLAPGFSSLQYRWAILSLRKRTAWKPGWQMPGLTRQFRLVKDPLESIPDEQGVYLLSEQEGGKQKPLYARATEHLRHAAEVHRSGRLLSAISDRLWRPDPESFVMSYTVLPSAMLEPVEKKVVEEKRPIFNVPRKAI